MTTVEPLNEKSVILDVPQNVPVVNPNAAVDGGEKNTQIVAVNDPKNNPMFGVVKDIAFNLILNIPPLRAKLGNLLDNPSIAIDEIAGVFAEVQSKIPEKEMAKLRKYITRENSRNALADVLGTAFKNIMADGKIDMNDAGHFMTLIHDIISLFNETGNNGNTDITLTGETVMYFLYFVTKCVLILTLDGAEEASALMLLDNSFKLVSIAVMPLAKMKCSCNPFACCRPKKN